MQKLFKSAALAAALAFASAAVVGCDVDVEEGEMPEVEVKGGEAPKVDVDTPEVEYETKEVKVPTGIKVPEEGSEDPDVD